MGCFLGLCDSWRHHSVGERGFNRLDLYQETTVKGVYWGKGRFRGPGGSGGVCFLVVSGGEKGWRGWFRGLREGLRMVVVSGDDSRL